MLLAAVRVRARVRARVRVRVYSRFPLTRFFF